MEVVPGVHTVPGLRWSRAYLIDDTSLTLVDAGLPWSAGKVIKYIHSIGRKPEELKLILMTHSHPDHAGGVRALQRRTGAEIAAHSEDTRPNGHNERELSYKGFIGDVGLPLPYFQQTLVDRLVDDGDVLPVLGGIRVLHTPGHTPGSVCYLLEDRGVAFTGDTVFSNGRRVSRSVPFPGYDGDRYQRSISRLAEFEFDALLGGHGSPMVGNASDQLRQLIAYRPKPPSWSDFLKSIPRRLARSRGLSGEDY